MYFTPAAVHRSEGIAPERAPEVRSADMIRMGKFLTRAENERSYTYLKSMRGLLQKGAIDAGYGKKTPCHASLPLSTTASFKTDMMQTVQTDGVIPVSRPGGVDNTKLISEVKSTSFAYVNSAIYPANGRFTTEASRKTGNRADVYDYPHASYSETAIGVACLPLKAKGHQAGTDFVDQAHWKHSGKGSRCHPEAHPYARLTCWAAMRKSQEASTRARPREGEKPADAWKTAAKNPFQWLFLRCAHLHIGG